jgi:resuscitation-promoting factor RpfA
MAKSRDAFRTISEVSEWLETPAHVLRFWESRFSQIKPVKRAGGRRYYRPNDMLLLGGIKRLLHDDGITIKGVQKVLREKGVKYVASLSHELSENPTATVKETPIEAIVEDTPAVEVEVLTGKAEPADAFENDPQPEEIAPEPETVTLETAIAEPDFQASETADDPADEPEIEAEQAVETAAEITDFEMDGNPANDRLSVLYGKLEALRNRVQGQMDAA